MLTYQSLLEYMLADWNHQYKNNSAQHTPILLLGPPGIGKSALGKSLADAMTLKIKETNPDAPPAAFLSLDLTSMASEDLIGVPTIRTENGNKYTEFAPQTWWIPFTQPNAYGVLILDDISAAHKDVQIAARQLVLYRRVGQVELSPNVYILITGNRRDDQSGASVLPAHFRNSTIIVSIEPDVEQWFQWYMKQHNVDPIVASYLQYKKENLSRVPKDADPNGAFPTPRTWHKLGMLLHAHGHLPYSILRPLICGLVGEGIGTEFIAYRNINMSLVNPYTVLLDPEKAIPSPEKMFTESRMDIIYGMAVGLSYEVSVLLRNPEKAKEITKKQPVVVALFRAIFHCFAHQRDYISLSLARLQSTLGSKEYNAACNAAMPDMAKLAKDEKIKPLIPLLRNDIGSGLS